MYRFSGNVSAGLAPWLSGDKAVGINAPLFRRNGGVYGIGFVIAHRFVGLIKISGMAAFNDLIGRRYALRYGGWCG